MAWQREEGTPGEPGYKRSGAGEAAMSPAEARARGFKWVGSGGTHGRAPSEEEYSDILREKLWRGDYNRQPLQIRQRILEDLNRSRERAGKDYEQRVKTFDKRWASKIDNGYFTGTEAAYQKYQNEYDALTKDISQFESKQPGFEKVFDTYNILARGAEQRQRDIQFIKAQERGLGGPSATGRYPLDIDIAEPGHFGLMRPVTPGRLEGEIGKFEEKWDPMIEDEKFIGSQGQYENYLTDFERLEGLEAKQLWGLPGKYEKARKATSGYITERTPAREDIEAKIKKIKEPGQAVFAFGMKRGIPSGLAGAYIGRIDGRSPLEHWEAGLERIYEAVQEDPLKTPVILAASYGVGKGVGKAAPVLRKTAPRATKYGGMALGASLTAAYGTSIADRVYREGSLAGGLEKFTEIRALEAIPMIEGFKLGRGVYSNEVDFLKRDVRNMLKDTTASAPGKRWGREKTIDELYDSPTIEDLMRDAGITPKPKTSNLDKAIRDILKSSRTEREVFKNPPMKKTLIKGNKLKVEPPSRMIRELQGLDDSPPIDYYSRDVGKAAKQQPIKEVSVLDIATPPKKVVLWGEALKSVDTDVNIIGDVIVGKPGHVYRPPSYSRATGRVRSGPGAPSRGRGRGTGYGRAPSGSPLKRGQVEVDIINDIKADADLITEADTGIFNFLAPLTSLVGRTGPGLGEVIKSDVDAMFEQDTKQRRHEKAIMVPVTITKLSEKAALKSLEMADIKAMIDLETQTTTKTKIKTEPIEAIDTPIRDIERFKFEEITFPEIRPIPPPPPPPPPFLLLPDITFDDPRRQRGKRVKTQHRKRGYDIINPKEILAL